MWDAVINEPLLCSKCETYLDTCNFPTFLLEMLLSMNQVLQGKFEI